MDYSQFLMMPQEIGLLLVFLLVFIYDTFMPARSQRFLPIFTTVLFAIYTAFSFVPCQMGELFGGMMETNPATWVMKCVPFLFSKERGRFFLLPFRTTGCKRRPGISGAPGKLRHADISDVKSAADGGIPPSANEKARRIFLRGLHSQNYTQSESSAASSFIQTVLSAPESHRIMPFGSRALPPVGTCTLP